MIATIWPGRTASAAAAVTCASTLPTATAMPSGSRVHSAARAVSRPARPPSGTGSPPSLAAKPAKSGLSAARKSSRRVAAVLVDALVPGGADVAGLHPGELPDDPVGGLDPALGAGGRSPGPPRGAAAPWRTATRRRSCRRSAASHGSPRAGGQLVDAVGVRLGGVVLPQLRPGVRPVRVPLAQRRAVGGRGQHGAGGEVGADADHVRRRARPRPRAPSARRRAAPRASPPGACSAQSGPSGTPGRAAGRSITPWAYSCTAEPSSAPSRTRTTTARPDSVPKSTPTTYRSSWLAFTCHSRNRRGSMCVRTPAARSLAAADDQALQQDEDEQQQRR